MRFAAVVFLALLLLPAVAMAGPPEDGRAALENGDYQTAIQILQPLAYQGNAEAQYLTGMLYRDGRGTKQDFTVGNRWVRASADQGYKSAQVSIGNELANAVDKNHDVQAYMWLSLAEATGGGPDTGMLAFVTARMTPEQIAEGKRLAADWKPSRAEAPAPTTATGKPETK